MLIETPGVEPEVRVGTTDRDDEATGWDVGVWMRGKSIPRYRDIRGGGRTSSVIRGTGIFGGWPGIETGADWIVDGLSGVETEVWTGVETMNVGVDL